MAQSNKDHLRDLVDKKTNYISRVESRITKKNTKRKTKRKKQKT